MRRPLENARPFGPVFNQSSESIQSRLTSGVREDIGFEDGGSVKVYFHSSSDMRELKPGEVNLIVTSPPYNVDYNYGSFADSSPYEKYMSMLAEVFTECYRKLTPECRLCINVPTIDKTGSAGLGVGNIPLASDLTDMLVDDPSFSQKFDTPEINELKAETDFKLYDHIIWNKGRFSDRSGLGSLPRPFRFDHDITHESILILQKPGKRNLSLVEDERLEASKLNKDWWTTGEGGLADTSAKDSVWNLRPSGPVIYQGEKVPTFPEELPKRLIQGHSFVGDLVVDPFAGAGTTLLAAKNTDRLGVGYELRQELKPLIESRVDEAV